MTADLQKIKKKLANNNYKMTSQRKAILKKIIENQGSHLSAEEIYEQVKEDDPNIGLATIYRTLELLCDLGIIHKLNFDDKCRRYELDKENEHHHHLICFECGEITEFNDDILEDFEENIKDEHSFEVVDHRIKFYGYCRVCQ